MSIEYTIKLKKEEVDLLMDDLIYCVNHRKYNSYRAEIHVKAFMSKKMIYTNFDKIKEEMTIRNFIDLFYNRIDRPKFREKYNTDENIGIKEWLESEVKE